MAGSAQPSPCQTAGGEPVRAGGHVPGPGVGAARAMVAAGQRGTGSSGRAGFSGTFYAQTQPRIAKMLAAAASGGVRVRLCFGDPASEAVTVRDREERIGGTLAAKIRSALTYYRSLADVDGCELRLHSTTLYASLFRYDDEILVNPHAYGEPASANPTFHLRRIDGGTIADHYMASFERVWETAVPWSGG